MLFDCNIFVSIPLPTDQKTLLLPDTYPLELKVELTIAWSCAKQERNRKSNKIEAVILMDIIAYYGETGELVCCSQEPGYMYL